MPDWVINIVLGIISSLIAAVLTIGAVGLLSKAARWTLTGLLGRLLDVDIDIVFNSPRVAADDIQKEIARSSEVRLFTGRGSELQRETFSAFFRSFSETTSREFKVLLPDPEPTPGAIDWVLRREEEVKAFDPAYGKGLLKSQIVTTLKFLEPFVGNRIQARVYSLPLLGRVLLTDRCAYLTPYSTLSHSRESRVIKYRRGGDMYDFLERLFCEVWEVSKPVSASNPPAQSSRVSKERSASDI